jgi:magnesium chelatase family protein
MALCHSGNLERHGFLVELLEFQPQVQEALREPFEEGKLRIVRAAKGKDFPAECLILGTTNLCPCGDYVPGVPVINCRFGKTKCQSYAKKLSGPLVDRFQILYFTKHENSRKQNLKDILKKVQKAQNFSELKRGQKKPNSRLQMSELGIDLYKKPWVQKSLPENISERRKLALFRVARSLADIEGCMEIQARHILNAAHLSLAPFRKIQRWEY